jgi:hypothetical protein
VRQLSLIAFVLIAISAVALVTSWLTLPATFAQAVDIARALYAPLLIVGLAFAALGLTGLPYPLGDRTKLRFGSPTVEPRGTIQSVMFTGTFRDRFRGRTGLDGRHSPQRRGGRFAASRELGSTSI